MTDNNNIQNQDLGLDLDTFAIRTKDGTVDVQATHAKFTQELQAFIATERVDNEVIASAVARAFSTHNVKTLPMGAVLQYTMEALSVPPREYSTIRDRVQRYVRNNVNRFKVAKGKNGGVSWLDDASSVPSAATPSSSGSIRPRSAH